MCRDDAVNPPFGGLIGSGQREYRYTKATSGVRTVAKTGDIFSCNTSFRTEMPGKSGTFLYTLNVSQGKTRTVSNGVSIGGTSGATSLAIAASTQTTSQTVTRHTYTNVSTDKRYLCGSDDFAPYASWVEEVALTK